MPNYTLGEFVISTGTIPASSDAEKLFRVFTAGSKPVRIEFVQYFGGDAGEFAQLTLIPPNVMAIGLEASATAGTIAITSGEYFIGAAAQNKPMSLGADNGGRGNPRFTPFIIPPFSSIAISQDTANTAEWSCTIGGYELDA
jgi:hypothetical protein